MNAKPTSKFTPLETTWYSPDFFEKVIAIPTSEGRSNIFAAKRNTLTEPASLLLLPRSDGISLPYGVQIFDAPMTPRMAEFILSSTGSGVINGPNYNTGFFKFENEQSHTLNSCPGMCIEIMNITNTGLNYRTSSCFSLATTTEDQATFFNTKYLPFLMDSTIHTAIAGYEVEPDAALRTDATRANTLDAMVDAFEDDLAAAVAPIKLGNAFTSLRDTFNEIAGDHMLATMIVNVYLYGVEPTFNQLDPVDGGMELQATNLTEAQKTEPLCKIGQFLRRQVAEVVDIAAAEQLVTTVKGSRPSAEKWTLTIDKRKFDQNNVPIINAPVSVVLIQCDDADPTPHSAFADDGNLCRLMDPRGDILSPPYPPITAFASKQSALKKLGTMFGVASPTITTLALESAVPFTNFTGIKNFGPYTTIGMGNSIDPSTGKITHYCSSDGGATMNTYIYNVFHTSQDANYYYLWAEIDLSTAAEYGPPAIPEILPPVGPNNKRQYTCFSLVRIPMDFSNMDSPCTHYDMTRVGDNDAPILAYFEAQHKFYKGESDPLYANGYQLPDIAVPAYSALATETGLFVPINNLLIELTLMGIESGIFAAGLLASETAI